MYGNGKNRSQKLRRSELTVASPEVASLFEALRSDVGAHPLPPVGSALSAFVDPAAIAAITPDSPLSPSPATRTTTAPTASRPHRLTTGTRTRQAFSAIGAFAGTLAGKLAFGAAVALAVTGGGQALGVVHLPGSPHHLPTPATVTPHTAPHTEGPNDNSTTSPNSSTSYIGSTAPTTESANTHNGSSDTVGNNATPTSPADTPTTSPHQPDDSDTSAPSTSDGDTATSTDDSNGDVPTPPTPSNNDQTSATTTENATTTPDTQTTNTTIEPASSPGDGATTTPTTDPPAQTDGASQSTNDTSIETPTDSGQAGYAALGV